MSETPRSLIEAVALYADEQKAFERVRDRRWPNGVACPHCGSVGVRFMAKRKAWQCNDCRKQFTAKTGTIFEDSPIPFSKWLPAIWLIANCKNGISSHEIARDLKVTQKTAWFMLHRIRLAMQTGTFEKLNGEVEVDETYIGGKARNMHYTKRKSKTRAGGAGKAMVIGFVERGGKVVTKHLDKVDRRIANNEVGATVEPSAKLYTDSLNAYDELSFYYQHQMVNHAVQYVRENVHTNTIENYWSLLKRALGGTYVSVEPFHLFRYLDEQAFRYNQRRATDAHRFDLALSQVTGKRLTYNELTGKELAADG